MSLAIRFTESALTDLEIGRDFYNAIADTLGDYFVSTLMADIESLQHFAGIHFKQFGAHRLLAKHFPFAIYYRSDKPHSSVTIIAVLDCRMNPENISARLTGQKP